MYLDAGAVTGAAFDAGTVDDTMDGVIDFAMDDADATDGVAADDAVLDGVVANDVVTEDVATDDTAMAATGTTGAA